MRRVLIAAFLALCAPGGPAAAHAFLEQAAPRVGSRVAAAPQEVRLSFSEPVEPAFCTVTVVGPTGFGGATAAKPAPGDRRTLVVSLRQPVPPGVYIVRWRVVSVDSHVTQGQFKFEVRP
jgi:methionine-rich copper-binding protein CopC